MKKIPKLLLKHDKEFFTYDIYFINKDNKIEHQVKFGLKNEEAFFKDLDCFCSESKDNGRVMFHDGDVFKKEGNKYHHGRLIE